MRLHYLKGFQHFSVEVIRVDWQYWSNCNPSVLMTFADKSIFLSQIKRAMFFAGLSVALHWKRPFHSAVIWIVVISTRLAHAMQPLDRALIFANTNIFVSTDNGTANGVKRWWKSSLRRIFTTGSQKMLHYPKFFLGELFGRMYWCISGESI